MDFSRQYGRVPSRYSDIVDYYLEAISGEDPGIGLGADQDTTLDSRDSSVYSTDALGQDRPAVETSDYNSSSLRQAFRNLCQVGLHMANLYHAETAAEQKLRDTERGVEHMAHQLALRRLDSDDHVASSSLALGHVMDVLVDETDGRTLSSTEPDILLLQEGVHDASRLRQELQALSRRLRVEERVLLRPTFERWRCAVSSHSSHSSHSSADTARNSAAAGPADPCEGRLDLDRAVQEFERLLPQLDRQRLQQFLGHITRALQKASRVGDGGHDEMYLQTFI